LHRTEIEGKDFGILGRDVAPRNLELMHPVGKKEMFDLPISKSLTLPAVRKSMGPCAIIETVCVFVAFSAKVPVALEFQFRTSFIV
jgi:hypothetical protein